MLTEPLIVPDLVISGAWPPPENLHATLIKT
jgi:hypothetical protein